QMLDEETGIRGYVISGEASSLQPYNEARPLVAQDLDNLDRLAGRRPEIAADVAAARAVTGDLDRFYARQIALVRSGEAGQAKAQQNVLAGKAPFDRYRRISTRLLARSNVIVADAQKSERRTLWTTLVLAAAAGAGAIAIALWLLLSVPRRIWSLYDVERSLRAAAERGDRASRSLAHVEDAVILLDPDGLVRYWNPAATRLLGVAEDDALGRPLPELLPELPAVEELLATEAPLTATPIARDGSERWLAARESRFAEGRVLVLQDTTEARQLERTRSEFLATASHELRTPLAAVYGAVRTLLRADRATDQALDQQLLTMIESESERLKEIVEQILVSAEVDRGEVRVRSEPCALRELCESAVAAASLQSPPGLELRLDAPEEIVVACDGARLRQVIVNLLDNAIKYSPGGGEISLRLQARPGTAVIEVADRGIGIPRDAHERIFEKFFRLDPEMRRGVGGSGLGLYISRELVRRMGGELRVHSGAGAGTTFSVELPREPAFQEPVVR
ncbi:MAG TPA: ATP-binding protein, partial [Gaiellaceae bacterium]|nr:ATP-binding protein [Gaiellaceae bacterium]